MLELGRRGALSQGDVYVHLDHRRIGLAQGDDPAGKLAAHSASLTLIIANQYQARNCSPRPYINASSRANQLFVSFNCGALPRTVHLELFGWRRGRVHGCEPPGKNPGPELADGGTVFSDRDRKCRLRRGKCQPVAAAAKREAASSARGRKSARRINIRVIAATKPAPGRSRAAECVPHDLWLPAECVSPEHSAPAAWHGDVELLANALQCFGGFARHVQAITPESATCSPVLSPATSANQTPSSAP